MALVKKPRTDSDSHHASGSTATVNLAHDSAENADRIKDMVKAIQDQIGLVGRDLHEIVTSAVAEAEKGKLINANLARIESDARDAAACPLLCAQLEVESDLSVRTALFNSVVMIGGPAAADGLMPLLRSEDPQLRNAAIEALSEMPDAVAPCIERLLDDADADVRIFTVNILGTLRHPRVQDWLMQVLAHDPDVNTVATAIDALTEAGDMDAIPALAIACQRFAGNPFIEFAASVARERIEAP